MSKDHISRRQNLRAAARVPGAILDAAVALLSVVVFPASIALTVITGGASRATGILVIIALAFATACTARQLPRIYASFRDYPTVLRLEISRASRNMRDDELWLVRDERVILSSSHHWRIFHDVIVISEDDFLALEKEKESIIMATMYRLDPTRLPVERLVGGTRLWIDEDGQIQEAPDGQSRAGRAAGILLSRRVTAGGRRTWATEEELRTLARQIAASELLGGDQPA
jgi:hypothetical protein